MLIAVCVLRVQKRRIRARVHCASVFVCVCVCACVYVARSTVVDATLTELATSVLIIIALLRSHIRIACVRRGCDSFLLRTSIHIRMFTYVYTYVTYARERDRPKLMLALKMRIAGMLCVRASPFFPA